MHLPSRGRNGGGSRTFVALALLAALSADAAAQSRVGEGEPRAGRVGWWRADLGVEHGFSNLVTRWRDCTGQGFALTGSGNGESQPEWLPVAIGGRPGVRFDGNDWLQGSGMPTGSYSKAVVAVLDELGAVNNVVSSASHHALWFAATPFARIFHSGDVVQSPIGVQAGVPFLLVATYDAGAGRATLHLDGLQVARVTGVPGNWDASLQLGAFGWGNFLQGTIGEVALFDHELDAGELLALHDDLRRRWLAPAPAARFSELPRPGQLFQRDANDRADVVVTGAVTSAGALAVTLEVARDGVAWWQQTKTLHYQPNGRAPFTFSVPLVAGRHDHDFAVSVDEGRGPRPVARVPAVTVGDLYVVHGQSNAQASDYWNEGLANQSQSRWIRSFGTTSISGAAPLDLHWDVADGEGSFTHGAIGQWAIRMAESLLHHEQMPIAIVNGAVGGTAIALHQRNDAWPEDPATIYGRLLLRMRAAGADLSCRALLWYQGESDAWNPPAWLSGWNGLRADWALDYPALQQVYVVQIRNDCGSGGHDVMELQRQLIDTWSDTQVMSSTGVPAHDGCHYLYAGYRDLGEKLARLLRRDFFGSSDTQQIDAPNLLHARWTDATQTKIDLTFRDALAGMVFEPGAEAHFVLGDGVAVVSGAANGNVVTLTLAGPSTARKMSYRGHPFDGPWLRNARGVGALCFEKQAIR